MSQETIEKKLEYLDQTKQLIGQALVTKGQTLDSETPFRDYVQKVLDIQTGYDTRDATAVASEVLKGKTFYNSQGKVEGTLVPKTGDIKKFETIEEMHNDVNVQEGDLAVVYRSEIQNAAVDSQFQVATFPKTVVLDTAVTSSIRLYYYPVDSSVMFDCYGTLSASRFYMNCYTEEGSIDIMYTSTDGITYTRTDNLDETIDFGTLIYYRSASFWDDRIGEFIKCGGMFFEGLYEALPTENQIQLINAACMTLTDTDFTISDSNEYLDLNILEQASTAVSQYKADGQLNSAVYLTKDKTNLLFVQINPTGTSTTIYNECPCYYNQNLYIGLTSRAYSYRKETVYQYNINTKTVQEVSLNTDLKYTYYSTDYQMYYSLFDGYYICDIKYTTKFSIVSSSNVWYIRDLNIADNANIAISPIYNYIPYYKIASTQLTLSDSNELLPGIKAYGKKGIVEGNDSIFDKITIEQYLKGNFGYEATDDTLIRNFGPDCSSTFGFINTDDTKLIQTSCKQALIPEFKTALMDTLSITSISTNEVLTIGNYQINYSELNSYGSQNVTAYIGVWDMRENILKFAKLYPTNTTGFHLFGITKDALFVVGSVNATSTCNVIRVDLNEFTDTIKQVNICPNRSTDYYQMPYSVCDPTGEYFFSSYGTWTGADDYKSYLYLYKWSTNKVTTVKKSGTAWIDYNLGGKCDLTGPEFIIIQNEWYSDYNTVPYILRYNPTSGTYIETTNTTFNSNSEYSVNYSITGMYDNVNDKYYITIQNALVNNGDSNFGLYEFKDDGKLYKIVDLGTSGPSNNIHYVLGNTLYLTLGNNKLGIIDLVNKTLVTADIPSAYSHKVNKMGHWLDGETSIYISTDCTDYLQLGNISNLPSTQMIGFTYKKDSKRYLMNSSIINPELPFKGNSMTSEEYQTALDTAYSIRDDATE